MQGGVERKRTNISSDFADFVRDSYDENGLFVCSLI